MSIILQDMQLAKDTIVNVLLQTTGTDMMLLNFKEAVQQQKLHRLNCQKLCLRAERMVYLICCTPPLPP